MFSGTTRRRPPTAGGGKVREDFVWVKMCGFEEHPGGGGGKRRRPWNSRISAERRADLDGWGLGRDFGYPAEKILPGVCIWWDFLRF